MALIWPGVPVSDWAIIDPRVSKIPHARSWVSRTTVLNAVRIRVTCCSLATDNRRFQRISSAMVSSAMSHHELAPVIDPALGARTDHDGRLPFFDNRGSVEGVTGTQSITVIDRDLDEAVGLGEVRRTA